MSPTAIKIIAGVSILAIAAIGKWLSSSSEKKAAEKVVAETPPKADDPDLPKMKATKAPVKKTEVVPPFEPSPEPEEKTTPEPEPEKPGE